VHGSAFLEPDEIGEVARLVAYNVFESGFPEVFHDLPPLLRSQGSRFTDACRLHPAQGAIVKQHILQFHIGETTGMAEVNFGVRRVFQKLLGIAACRNKQCQAAEKEASFHEAFHSVGFGH
jgi:hypothetical protein